MKKVINGLNHEFAKVGDVWVGVKPVSIAQYHGDPDGSGKPITKLTRRETLAWCYENGVRLPTEKEWESALTSGVVNKVIEEEDVWEEIGPAGGRRVLRGGTWFTIPWNLRRAGHDRPPAVVMRDYVGFRIVYEGEDK